MRRVFFCIAAAALVVAALPHTASAYRYKHLVLPGESLRSIAKRYHISVRRLRRLNRIRGRKGFVRAFRKLRIITSVPSRVRRRVRYVVRRGDSLGKIARRHKISTRALRALNHWRLRGGRRLRPGMKLWVVKDGAAPRGSARGFFQLAAGPGFKVRYPHRSWGTFTTVTGIADAFAAYARRFPRAKRVEVWDISRRHGGYFKPHMSHRRGRDVDVPYVLKRKYKTFRYANAENIDPRRSWYLIRAFIRTGKVKMIFVDYRLQRVLWRYAARHGMSKRWLRRVFQYARRRAAHKTRKRCKRGRHKRRCRRRARRRARHQKRSPIIRHESGHASHFHVRFKREKPRKHKTSSVRGRRRRARRGRTG